VPCEEEKECENPLFLNFLPYEGRFTDTQMHFLSTTQGQQSSEPLVRVEDSSGKGLVKVSLKRDEIFLPLLLEVFSYWTNKFIYSSHNEKLW
jgi:hypothetical protein